MGNTGILEWDPDRSAPDVVLSNGGRTFTRNRIFWQPRSICAAQKFSANSVTTIRWQVTLRSLGNQDGMHFRMGFIDAAFVDDPRCEPYALLCSDRCQPYSFGKGVEQQAALCIGRGGPTLLLG